MNLSRCLNLFKNNARLAKFCNSSWSTAIPFLCYLILFVTLYFLTIPSKRHLFRQIETNGNGDNSNYDPGKLAGKRDELDDVRLPIELRTEYDKTKDPTIVLRAVFKKADQNGNGLIDVSELTKWINFKIKQHISKAIRTNYQLFALIDSAPKDGRVTWQEYHEFFLKQKEYRLNSSRVIQAIIGLRASYVKNHDESRHAGLERSIKEHIMRDKAFWKETPHFDPNSLTLDEFLAFMHPESSPSNQLTKVEDLYVRFDQNGDDVLTEDEFAGATLNGVSDTLSILFHQPEKVRRIEFQRLIDVNRDGHADRLELLRYVAPQNPRRSELEAQTLIALADSNHDDKLSVDEILEKQALFMTSKMVSTGRSFHDEF